MKNLISKTLVDSLQLVTKPHPKPYTLGWVKANGHTTVVDKMYIVTFAITLFLDTVDCDVTPMDYNDILLGYPYQHDRRTLYDGYHNTYTLHKNGKIYKLTSADSVSSSSPVITGNPTNLPTPLNKWYFV